MNIDSQDQTNRTIFRIAGVGASLAFGFMVGTLFAIKPIPNGLTFQLTVGAVLSFVLAAALAWFYWRLVERMSMSTEPESRRKKFIIFSIGLVVVGIVSFLYPIKFVPPAKRFDVAVGLALAVACITGIAIVMLRVKRFLDADLKRSEDEDRAH